MVVTGGREREGRDREKERGGGERGREGERERLLNLLLISRKVQDMFQHQNYY